MAPYSYALVIRGALVPMAPYSYALVVIRGALVSMAPLFLCLCSSMLVRRNLFLGVRDKCEHLRVTTYAHVKD